MKNNYLVLIIFPVFVLFLLYTLILSHKINLVTADLGRHITNGKYFFLDKSVLDQNFYSYSHSEFSTINHHWAVGVLFYYIYQLSGFTGLQLLFIITSLVTFLIFFLLAKSKTNLPLLIVLSFLLLPLLAERTEIRPEVFSNFFAAVIFLILHLYNQKKINYRFLFLIPLIEIFWVNMHIYFFLGPFLVGSFLFESFIRKNQNTPILFWLFFITCLSTLLNPLGITGSLAPFNEFKNYGYELSENQSVGFMVNYFPRSVYSIFKFILFFLTSSYVSILLFARKQYPIANFLIGVLISFMGWTMIRNLTLYALFSLPLILMNIDIIKSNIPPLYFYVDNQPFQLKISKINTYFFTLFISIYFLCTYFFTDKFRQFPYWRELGFGLESGNSDAANYFKNNQLKGPIYNNYDNGGYLIFHLFPTEKVYIDNRPEAYPASFFSNEYIPSQNTEEKWQEIDSKYHFNTIFFSHTDQTPWAQKFLESRLKDDKWTQVYTDTQSIIFTRRK